MVDNRPNLLYLHSDQHNPAVLGCAGDPLVQTPHLDGLAAQGVVFDQLYCSSPICVPSRMSMLTGRHPYENEVWTNTHILSSAVPTLAHALGAGGYRPVLIGRMHARGPDQLHGYAERLVGDHHPNYLGGRPNHHGLLKGTTGQPRLSLERSGVGQSAYQVHDEEVTAAAVAHLRQVGERRRAGQAADPFCLTLGFMLPHQPYVARQEDFDRYRKVMTMPEHDVPCSDALHPFLRWWREQCGYVLVPDAETRRARTAYWVLVTRLDTMIGEILAAVRRNDLVGMHGLWQKETFYEGSVTVPGILTWPGVLPAGVQCDRVASSLDLNATMLDTLGAPALPRSHGRSLLPLLHGEAEDWEDVAFSELCTDAGWYKRMIRCNEWKLYYYHGCEPQLFNLENDPHELKDRVQDPVCQEVREHLTERVLDGWDPEWVAAEMSIKRQEQAIQQGWAQHTQPPDRFR